MAHLPLHDQLIERAKGFFECNLVAGLVFVVQPFEQAHGPVRPVELIEVDVIGAQPFEAGIGGGMDLLAREAGFAAALAQPGKRAAPGNL